MVQMLAENLEQQAPHNLLSKCQNNGASDTRQKPAASVEKLKVDIADAFPTRQRTRHAP
jgi:hypothetical protein